MFLHLGENVVVPIKDVIGIFDMETSMYSSDTIQFLRLAEEDGFVERITKEKPNTDLIKYRFHSYPFQKKRQSRRKGMERK